jgi:ribosomal protein L3
MKMLKYEGNTIEDLYYATGMTVVNSDSPANTKPVTIIDWEKMTVDAQKLYMCPVGRVGPTVRKFGINPAPMYG